MRSLAFLSLIFAGGSLAHPTQSTSAEIDRRGWPDVTDFLSKVAAVFPVNVMVDTVCDTITVGQLGMSILFGIPSSENDGCGDITLLYARGTCDAGNVGVLVGPWFFRSLGAKGQKMGKSVAVNGFAYPATVEGYLNGSEGNGDKFALVIKDTIKKCPNSKLVLGAYSQGGMVIHDAAASLDRDTSSKISSVVIFGHPYSGQPLPNIEPSRVKVFCHEGDNICENGPLITFEHLNYAEDADAAADFVLSKVS